MQSIREIGSEQLPNEDMSDAEPVDPRQELVGRIAAGLAHDLNGPIGVMLGFTQLAREKLESEGSDAPSGVVEYLKMIESAGENARGLARDMWNFAKAVPGEIEEFDIAELFETSARLVGPTMRVAAIEPPPAGELPAKTIRGDRALWAQAIVGVMIDVSGALPGGGSLAWHADVSPEDTKVTIRLVASPNDPETSATPPVPAEEWKIPDNCLAIINGLGGVAGPMRDPGGGNSGIEIAVPTHADRI